MARHKQMLRGIRNRSMVNNSSSQHDNENIMLSPNKYYQGLKSPLVLNLPIWERYQQNEHAISNKYESAEREKFRYNMLYNKIHGSIRAKTLGIRKRNGDSRTLNAQAKHLLREASNQSLILNSISQNQKNSQLLLGDHSANCGTPNLSLLLEHQQM